MIEEQMSEVKLVRIWHMHKVQNLDRKHLGAQSSCRN